MTPASRSSGTNGKLCNPGMKPAGRFLVTPGRCLNPPLPPPPFPPGRWRVFSNCQRRCLTARRWQKSCEKHNKRAEGWFLGKYFSLMLASLVQAQNLVEKSTPFSFSKLTTTPWKRLLKKPLFAFSCADFETRRWGLVKKICVHRLGRLRIGGTSG